MKSPAEIVGISEKVYGVMTDLTDSAAEMMAVLNIVNVLLQVQAQQEQERAMQAAQAGRIFG